MSDSTGEPTAAELFAAMRKALALLATSVAGQQDAAHLLALMQENYRAALTPGPPSPFDELMTAMLLAVSSTALKQRPDDPAVKAMYQALRPGKRH